MRYSLPSFLALLRRGLCGALASLMLLTAGGSVAAASGESGQLLSAADLQTLQPAYEAFLNQLADLIIAKGLLAEDQRAEWLQYQLGDFYQNGGYGMIAAMYTPDLLEWARPQDKLLQLEKTLPGGTLTMQTLGAYVPLEATLPGLMLEVTYTDAQGLPIPCRFRWHSERGGFLTWDGFTGQVVDVGNALTNDGRLCYWTDQPPASDAQAVWVIQLDIIDPADDSLVLASAALALQPQGGGWVLSEGALQ